MMHLLSFGTVVTLMGSEVTLMVVDWGVLSGDEKFDYLGVLWPEGSIPLDVSLSGEDDWCACFNQADIKEVMFIAPMDEDSLKNSEVLLGKAIDEDFPIADYLKSRNVYLANQDDGGLCDPDIVEFVANSEGDVFGIYPLGTVVEVNANRNNPEEIPFEVMICGFCQETEKDEFKYQIMMYHEGYLYPKRRLFMKQKEILDVKRFGFVNFDVQRMLTAMMGDE